MANGDQRKHWQHVSETVVPDEGGAARIKADNDEMMKRVDENIGVPTGRTFKDRLTGLTWQERRLPDGNTIRYRDSNEDGMYWSWDPDTGKPVEKPMVGQQNYENIEALRKDLAEHPENPYFRTLYPNSYANASPGELNARRFLRDTFAGYNSIDERDREQIDTADTTRLLMKKAEDLFMGLGGKQNLDQLSQSWQNFNSQTDIDKWMGGPGTPEQKAIRNQYLQLLTVIQQLKAQGLNVGSQAEGMKSSGGDNRVLDTLLLLSKGTPYGALLATAGSSIIDTAKNMANGNFKVDEFRAQLPALHDQLAKAEAQKVIGLTSPSAKTLVDKQERQMGNAAMDDLESHNLGPGDVSTRILPEFGGKTEVTTPPPRTADEEEALRQAEPFVATGQSTQQGGDKGGGEPPAKPAPTATSTPTPAPKPTATPKPSGSPSQRNQPQPTGQVTGAPTSDWNVRNAPISPASQSPAQKESLRKAVEELKSGGGPQETGAYAAPPGYGVPPDQAGASTGQPQSFTGETGAFGQPKTQLAKFLKPADIVQSTATKIAPKLGKPFLQGLESQAGKLGGTLVDIAKAPIDFVGNLWREITGHAAEELPPNQQQSQNPNPQRQLANNPEAGAPLGAPDDRPRVRQMGNMQVPHLFRQEHVDLLQSGTPFYWADHPHPYVKV